MKSSWYVFPENFYSQHLVKISDVSFTRREIDVIACMISGRSAKKIAYFLSLSPRTVENYVHNIMVKLKCNSKESIIDFIEKTEKLLYIKEYYSLLLKNAAFEKCLKNIFFLKGEQKLACLIVYWQEDFSHSPFIDQLIKHLKLAGIMVSLDVRKGDPSFSQLNKETHKNTYAIYIIPDILLKKFQSGFSEKDEEFFQPSRKITYASNNKLLLFSDESLSSGISAAFKDIGYLSFDRQKNYYDLGLEILKKLLPKTNFKKVIETFEDNNGGLNNFLNPIHIHLNHQNETISQEVPQGAIETQTKNVFWVSLNTVFKKYFFVTNKKLWFGFCLILLVLFKLSISSNIDHLIHSDLPLPTTKVLLERPQLLRGIRDKLNSKQGILVLAITGVGGAGKTTLARQYARQQKNSLIWEINATTAETLINSLENLLLNLSNTEEEIKTVRIMQNIKDSNRRAEKIITLTKQMLKHHSDWILIYDNADNFRGILNYLPSDSASWGKGRVIITSRDRNIASSQYVNYVIDIPDLSSQEKLTLFYKVLYNKEIEHANSQELTEISKFLNKLPSLPLDIFIAASYIKATNISLNQYLKYNHSNEFEAFLEDLLKESNSYTKTRLSIIVSSLEEVLAAHENFKELLFFVSLLNPKNIQKSLLDMYEDNIIVAHFLYYLNKYSLIINSADNEFFSMHHSTQEICRNYITNILNTKNNPYLMSKLETVLDTHLKKIIEDENITAMKEMRNHCENLLSHKEVLDGTLRGIIGSKLSVIYYHLGDYSKASSLLEEAIPLLKSNSIAYAEALVFKGNIVREQGDYKKALELLEKGFLLQERHSNLLGMALALTYIGNVQRSLGDYEQAKTSFERSLTILKSHYPKHYISIARISGYLAIVYSSLNDFDKAITLFQQSLITYKQYYKHSKLEYIWIQVYLGNIYRELGLYIQARELLEECVVVYKNHYPSNHLEIAWVSVYLGKVYLDLKQYMQAQKLFEESLDIYKKHYSSKHTRYAWVLGQLGKVHQKLGDYKKSKNLLNETLEIYKKNYGPNHIETARASLTLGQNFLSENQLDMAESFMTQSLVIFEECKHPEVFTAYESLGELFLKRATIDKNNSSSLRNKSASYFELAIKNVEKYSPENTFHQNRLKSKMNHLRQS